MPLYKPKNPDRFPASFHDILRAPNSLYPLGEPGTEDECRRLARKFRAFRMCLRVFNQHPLSNAEVTRVFKTSIRPSQSEPGAFQLWITSRPKVSPELEKAFNNATKVKEK